MRKNVEKSERIIAGTLRLGSGLSIFLMAAGLAMYFAKGPGMTSFQATGFTDLYSLLMGVARLEPQALMTLGVVVLLVTPFFRVVAAIISFLIVEKDVKYALISLGVLVILAVSYFVPGFK